MIFPCRRYHCYCHFFHSQRRRRKATSFIPHSFFPSSLLLHSKVLQCSEGTQPFITFTHLHISITKDKCIEFPLCTFSWNLCFHTSTYSNEQQQVFLSFEMSFKINAMKAILYAGASNSLASWVWSLLSTLCSWMIQGLAGGDVLWLLPLAFYLDAPCCLWAAALCFSRWLRHPLGLLICFSGWLQLFPLIALAKLLQILNGFENQHC